MWGWNWASRHVGELYLWSPGQGEDKTPHPLPPSPQAHPGRGVSVSEADGRMDASPGGADQCCREGLPPPGMLRRGR